VRVQRYSKPCFGLAGNLVEGNAFGELDQPQVGIALSSSAMVTAS
jgi:hypothetical protein